MYRTQHQTASNFDQWFKGPVPITNTTQRFQQQWFGDRHSQLHDHFFGNENISKIQQTVKSIGKFNDVPESGTVLECMSRQWEIHAIPNNTIDLVSKRNNAAILNKMNSSVIRSLVSNMHQMRAAYQTYIYDVNTHNMGRVGQFDRPEYAKFTRGTIPLELPLR